MKIKYLGTAAAERIPALFCNCDICKNAETNGGREIRTQQQALLDDGRILIDFSGDSYLHRLHYGINLSKIKNLLITHWHSDHFYGEDLAYRMSNYARNVSHILNVYGNEYVYQFYKRAFDLEGQFEEERLKYHVVYPYQKFQIEDYTIYPLPAVHGHREGDCFVYAIQGPDNKVIFYGHDTGYPTKENLDYLKAQELHFDLVSLDCTAQLNDPIEIHMNWNEDVQFKNELIRSNLADEETTFIASHFSHNGGKTYQEMDKITQKENIITAYDGMELNF